MVGGVGVLSVLFSLSSVTNTPPPLLQQNCARFTTLLTRYGAVILPFPYHLNSEIYEDQNLYILAGIIEALVRLFCGCDREVGSTTHYELITNRTSFTDNSSERRGGLLVGLAWEEGNHN